MPIDLKIPAVGESITEVVIGAWRKKVGDTVEKDEDLVELETDKATFDLPAPAAGVITQILKKAGDTAAVGDVIGSIGDAFATKQGTTKDEPVKRSTSKPEPAKQEPVKQAPVKQAPASVPAPAQPSRRDKVTAEPLEPVTTDAPHEKQPAAATNAAARGGERVVPMSPIRRRIAQRLVEAQANA